MNNNFNIPEQITFDEQNNQKYYNGANKTAIIANRLTDDDYYSAVAGVQIILDSSQIKMTKEKLTRIIEILTCTICQDVFYSPYLNKTCQHIFCKSCYVEWTKLHKSCPSCRIPSKRRTIYEYEYLRKIISIIMPNIKKFKENEASSYEKNKKNFIFKEDDARIQLKSEEIVKIIIENKPKDQIILSSFNNANDSKMTLSACGLLDKKRAREEENNTMTTFIESKNDNAQVKIPKFDINHIQVPLSKVIADTRSNDLAWIRLIPLKLAMGINPFDNQKLLLSKKATLNEIAIYLHAKLAILPNRVFFILKEDQNERSLTNLSISIQSIIDNYATSSEFDLYYECY